MNPFDRAFMGILEKEAFSLQILRQIYLGTPQKISPDIKRLLNIKRGYQNAIGCSILVFCLLFPPGLSAFGYSCRFFSCSLSCFRL
jgi:hypothetical protein